MSNSNSCEPEEFIQDGLLAGERPVIVARRLMQMGFDGKDSLARVNAALSDPTMKKALQYSSRARKLEALLDVFAQIYSSQSSCGTVAERLDLSAEQFKRDFYYQHQPVIARRYAIDWPAVQKWSPTFFFEVYGDVRIRYRVGDDRYRSGQVETGTMRDFIRRMLAAAVSNHLYAVGTDFAFKNEELTALLSDLREPDWLSPCNLTSQNTRLWIGPKGTITPLHYDIMGAFFVQVYGRKEFRMASPWFTPRLQNNDGVYSAVDPASSTDLSDASVKWLVATVEAGDALYIPVGWWHWVYALEPSISVTLFPAYVDGQMLSWQ